MKMVRKCYWYKVLGRKKYHRIPTFYGLTAGKALCGLYATYSIASRLHAPPIDQRCIRCHGYL